jgi:hypothetical protein
MSLPSLLASQLPAQNGRAKSIAAIIAGLCAIILSACTPQPVTAVLFDFETDSDLDHFAWKCRSRFEISSDYSSTGKSSLRFEFHPTQRVGFSTGAVPHDWSSYKSFDFWVYNPSATTVPLNLQINRRVANGKFNHLIAKAFEIAPGPNKVSILLQTGLESRGNQSSLHKVDGFYIFMQDIPFVTVLYFDAFELHGTVG